METQTAKQRPNSGHVILVPHRDTARLLEVYVKRSLSLNDGTLGNKRAEKKEKWVSKKFRRHSSDPSLHLDDALSDEGIATAFEAKPPKVQHETDRTESEKASKKPKKNKKPSFWKSFLGIFSRKANDDKDEERDSPSEMPETFEEDDISDAVTTCLPTNPVTLQKKKSLRRKSIKRRFSKKHLPLIKANKPVITSADITGVEAVEPTYSYYEKMSEELEKIVHEVKEKEEVQPLSDEEVINRLIALTKEQGDIIDIQVKDNPTLNNFFQQMSYTSFQKMADAYLVKEGSPTHKPVTVLPTAPELVKLAFMLDFTARIAGLSKQNVGHITGLGHRYLQDRFEYKQACTDHPWSDNED
ncbi:Bcl-2-like protein 12 [Channa argus]|uniref:Bcl-2-like protein 12 n=1 Tax=Channa argus TaxID=215402 RepID=A0A6G1PIM8_CHAAH|nr:Bcl-2-like protein 12 [Channa argus]KAK2915345.1 hypothetical protein Q8A73_005939 [Channa argus]